MVRGTTPTYTFSIPFAVNLVSSLRIIFSQNNLSVKKKKEDCSLTDSKISVRLSQEDTLSFKKGELEITIRVLTPAGDALASNIMHDYVYECNDNEVLK